MSPKESPLVDAFAQALRARRVLFILGAGVSRQTTKRAPTWPELVRSGIDYASQHVLAPDRPARWAQVKDVTALDERQLIKTAQEITQTLEGPYGGLWRDWLDASLGALKATNPPLLATIGRLRMPVASCNYDTLAEQITQRGTVTWREPGEIQRLLYQAPENATSKVIHLHGVFNRPDTVVLGTKSYKEITRDPSFQDLLRALSWSHLIVFLGVGAGLSDPNFGALRLWMRNSLAKSSEQHLMLTREQDYHHATDMLAGSPRVMPLVYGKRYQDLATFLKRVAKRSAQLAPVDETSRVRSAAISAAKKGNADASFSVGLELREQNRLPEAKDYLERSAAAGHTGAAYTLGLVLRDDGEIAEAEHWLETAATRDDAAAAFTLGLMYEDRGDVTNAFEWQQRAANGGDIAGAFTFGRMLRQRGDHEQSVAWLKRAAEYGDQYGIDALHSVLAEHPYLADTPTARPGLS